MAHPAVRLVTLTVTEKGYCHEPSTGRLNPGHPDILHDLASGLPVGGDLEYADEVTLGRAFEGRKLLNA